MATLSAMGFNLVGSMSVFCVSIVLFGTAVKRQNKFIAARCAARPPTVIYNPSPYRDPCQNRGNPTFGWIPWTMGLTYETMLRGVPGTGTRNDGLSGALLKVNLDGIILLRFHHLCLRVCLRACILYLLVILPIYATTQCRRFGETKDDDSACLQEDFFTDEYSYDRLTLANIPVLISSRYDGLGDVISSSFLPEHGGLLARLYAVVFVTWAVTYYVLRELRAEWGEVLALRRVYYLEADHWQDRKEELDQTFSTIKEERREQRQSMEMTGKEKNASYLVERQPWIPHPEQRDTVPNIELYSVLVGGLPTLPRSVVHHDEAGAVHISRKQSIDWQLSVTTAFFDHCVPNQPGFSSSIAAVTVLPSASHLTEAWNKWYRVAAKLRRLRFIRKELAARKEIRTVMQDLDIEEGGNTNALSVSRRVDHKSRRKSSLDTANDKDEYFQEILGSTDDFQVEDKLLYALDFGPEQIAVYTREFALGAANLAPYGWHENGVLQAKLPDLIMMERAAVEAVHEANIALREAQERIGEDVSDLEIDDASDSRLHAIMRSVENTALSSIDDDTPEGRVAETYPGRRQASFRESWAVNSVISRSTSTVESAADGSSSFAVESQEYETKLADDDGRLGRRTSHTTSISSGTGTSASDSTENGDGQERGRARSSSASPSRRRNRSRNRSSRAVSRPTRLPGDLGLEAGLWMERKSGHGESTDRRRRAPRNSKPTLGHSMHGPYTNDTKKEESRLRSRSADDADVESGANPLVSNYMERPKPIRALSFDDADLLADLSESQRLLFTLNSPKGNARRDWTNGTEQQEESIWERLRKDQHRKQNIRDRLHNIQKVERLATRVEQIISAADEAPESPRHTQSDQEESNLRETSGDSGSQEESYLRETSGDSGSQNAPTQFRRKQSIPHPNRIPENDDGSINESPVKQNRVANPRSLRSMSGTRLRHEQSSSNIPLIDDWSYERDFEQANGLRHRDTGFVVKDEDAINEVDDKWSRVRTIVNEAEGTSSGQHTKDHTISSGAWTIPSCADIFRMLRTAISSFWTHVVGLNAPRAVDEFVRDSSYAVVTFTSRQAAVAARSCLSDSRGNDRWITFSEIPSPPLADAPVFNMSSFRGCVRPVSLSISDKQKMLRRSLAVGMLVSVYCFYTLPLTLAQQLISPQSLSKVFPEIKELQAQSDLLENIFSGLIPALVWTLFFAICPSMFKMIANFGSNATSVATAENSALSYFWWFMLLSAFTSTSISTAMIKGFSRGLSLGSELQGVIENTAAAIPKTVSAAWLNWMIIRVFAVLPTQYLLQLNTFVFSCLGLQCCARSVRGGGAGGPVPYRIYVDSGVVMLCVFALAPASPLIAASALAYFVVFTPMLRWTLIFLYRPKYDLGGGRFPFIFDVCISGVIAGQTFLFAMMILKRATGPAIAAVCPMIPTLWFRYFVRKRYLRAFLDAALLQTSLLDGWDTNAATSTEKREEFRKFLVDCHKAAYVPVCIAGDKSSMITAEPAVVVPSEYDDDASLEDENFGAEPTPFQRRVSVPMVPLMQQSSRNLQNMPMMRRTRSHDVQLGA